jgi:hypothetical protein
VFLLSAGLGVLLVFGLPILFAPYHWADAFGWDTEPHTDLTTYFARVVGAIVSALRSTHSLPAGSRGATVRCSR